MLARGLAVLTSFGPDESSLCLSQFARRCHLPIATVHRLVAELTASGFLHNGEDGIRLGAGVALLGLRGSWNDLFWRFALGELGCSAVAPGSLLTLSARREGERVSVGALWEHHGYVVVSCPSGMPHLPSATHHVAAGGPARDARGSAGPDRTAARVAAPDADGWALEVTRARLPAAVPPVARPRPAPATGAGGKPPAPCWGPVGAEDLGAGPPRPQAPSPRGSMLSRGLEVLRSFPAGVPDVALIDLTRRCGLPRSTTHRLVGELAAAGMLEVTASGLRIGPRLMAAALQAPAVRRLVGTALVQQRAHCGPGRVVDLWVHDLGFRGRLTSMRPAAAAGAGAALGITETSLLDISARGAAARDAVLHPVDHGLLVRRIPITAERAVAGAALVMVARRDAPGARTVSPAGSPGSRPRAPGTASPAIG